ncbi:hypothetical protein Ancab_036974 [Ancistrocladus abbreviatus]
MGRTLGKDQDIRMANLMQDVVSMQAKKQAQASSSKKSSEPFGSAEKQAEMGQLPMSDPRIEPKLPMQHMTIGQSTASNIIRPMQKSQIQQGIPTKNQIVMAAQLRAVHAWALECNIDLSQPGNANLMAQLIPLMQSRMVAQQKANEGSSQPSPGSMRRQHVTSPPVASKNSPRANSSSDISEQSSYGKARQTNRENQGLSAQSTTMVNELPPMQAPRPPVNQASTSNDGGSGNHFPSQTGTGPRLPNSNWGSPNNNSMFSRLRYSHLDA